MNIIGIASGFFNPLHVGHLDYLYEAKKQCDFLVVIVNSDFQVHLKHSVPFMNVANRMRILNALEPVNMTLASTSDDISVVDDIEYLAEFFQCIRGRMRFFNSGDRNKENTPEFDICSKMGVELVILNQPKIESSSDILMKIIDNKN